MKIPLGGGAYMEPDDGNRNTRFHMRIVATKRIKGTRCGYRIRLECGHEGMIFGDLEKADGVMLCIACRNVWIAAMN